MLVVVVLVVVLVEVGVELLGWAGPLPVYVVALAPCGITTGMGYSLAQLAVQNVLPAERSAEGTRC